jgi:hypothetical protein
MIYSGRQKKKHLQEMSYIDSQQKTEHPKISSSDRKLEKNNTYNTRVIVTDNTPFSFILI